MSLGEESRKPLSYVPQEAANTVYNRSIAHSSFLCAGSINTVSGCLFLYRSWSGRSTPNKGRNHQPGHSLSFSFPKKKRKEPERRPKHLLERERKGAQGLTVRPLTSSRIPAALIFFFFAAYRGNLGIGVLSVQGLTASCLLFRFQKEKKTREAAVNLSFSFRTPSTA